MKPTIYPPSHECAPTPLRLSVTCLPTLVVVIIKKSCSLGLGISSVPLVGKVAPPSPSHSLPFPPNFFFLPFYVLFGPSRPNHHMCPPNTVKSRSPSCCTLHVASCTANLTFLSTSQSCGWHNRPKSIPAMNVSPAPTVLWQGVSVSRLANCHEVFITNHCHHRRSVASVFSATV